MNQFSHKRLWDQFNNQLNEFIYEVEVQTSDQLESHFYSEAQDKLYGELWSALKMTRYNEKYYC